MYYEALFVALKLAPFKDTGRSFVFAQTQFFAEGWVKGVST
jgi:hypothetical protein